LYKRVIRIIERMIIAISAAVVGFDLVCIFAAVVGRLFGVAFALLEEFPRLLVSLIAFLGVAGLLRSNQHVNVEYFPTKLKGRALARLEIVLFLSTAASAIFLLVASIEAMLYLRHLGEVTVSEIELRIWWIYTAQVIGFALLLITSLELTITRIYFLVSHQENPN
jgi:TRAP-type C4-dicarboxylate transport system permease small subunit